MQLAAMFFRIIMEIVIFFNNLGHFPRDVSAVVTGMDTLNQASHKRLELAKCVV